MPSDAADETISVCKKCRKHAISKLIFEFFFLGHSPKTSQCSGSMASLPKPTPLGALRLPRIARNRGSLRLPYLEIKLNFECTARFCGLAPPLALCHILSNCRSCQISFSNVFFSAEFIFAVCQAVSLAVLPLAAKIQHTEHSRRFTGLLILFASGNDRKTFLIRKSMFGSSGNSILDSKSSKRILFFSN